MNCVVMDISLFGSKPLGKDVLLFEDASDKSVTSQYSLNLLLTVVCH